MPNRYIRESAIESEPVNSLSWQSEVFYRRLLNRVDDFGRYTANLSLLRASIFPLQLNKVTIPNIQRGLLECEVAGLLFTYSEQGKDFLVINKWEKGRAKESRYPAPPASVCERMKTYVYGCKQTHADAPDSDSDSDNDTDTGSDKGAPDGAALSVIIPLVLNCPEFLTPWNQWQAIRRRGKKPKSTWDEYFAKQLTWLESFGASTAIKIVSDSARHEWQGLFEPKGSGKKQGASTGEFSNVF